jgi:hypothetical protein
VMRRGSVVVAVNLAPERQVIPVPGTPVRVLLASESGFGFGDGAVGIAGESVAVLKLI